MRVVLLIALLLWCCAAIPTLPAVKRDQIRTCVQDKSLSCFVVLCGRMEECDHVQTWLSALPASLREVRMRTVLVEENYPLGYSLSVPGYPTFFYLSNQLPEPCGGNLGQVDNVVWQDVLDIEITASGHITTHDEGIWEDFMWSWTHNLPVVWEMPHLEEDLHVSHLSPLLLLVERRMDWIAFEKVAETHLTGWHDCNICLIAVFLKKEIAGRYQNSLGPGGDGVHIGFSPGLFERLETVGTPLRLSHLRMQDYAWLHSKCVKGELEAESPEEIEIEQEKRGGGGGVGGGEFVEVMDVDSMLLEELEETKQWREAVEGARAAGGHPVEDPSHIQPLHLFTPVHDSFCYPARITWKDYIAQPATVRATSANSLTYFSKSPCAKCLPAEEAWNAVLHVGALPADSARPRCWFIDCGGDGPACMQHFGLDGLPALTINKTIPARVMERCFGAEANRTVYYSFHYHDGWNPVLIRQWLDSIYFEGSEAPEESVFGEVTLPIHLVPLVCIRSLQDDWRPLFIGVKEVDSNSLSFTRADGFKLNLLAKVGKDSWRLQLHHHLQVGGDWLKEEKHAPHLLNHDGIICDKKNMSVCLGFVREFIATHWRPALWHITDNFDHVSAALFADIPLLITPRISADASAKEDGNGDGNDSAKSAPNSKEPLVDLQSCETSAQDVHALAFKYYAHLSAATIDGRERQPLADFFFYHPLVQESPFCYVIWAEQTFFVPRLRRNPQGSLLSLPEFLEAFVQNKWQLQTDVGARPAAA
jgi:hypothetical protein